MPRRSKKSPIPRKAPFRKKRRLKGKYKAKGPSSITIKNGRIVMLLPKRLRSPNQRANWRSDHGERKAWTKLIESAEASIDWNTIREQFGSPVPVITRMRLEILRLAPNQRYMMDADNLAFCAKRLQDTLKEKGYIIDDNMRWLDGPYVTQAVSEDKCYWTIVTLSPAADSTLHEFPVISAKAEAKRRLEASVRPRA